MITSTIIVHVARAAEAKGSCTRLTFELSQPPYPPQSIERDFYDGEHPLETTRRLRNIADLLDGMMGEVAGP